MVDGIRDETARLFERHTENAKLWTPDEEIPYDIARNYRDLPWDESQYPLREATRSALIVNTLTEDNLPYYTETLLSTLPLNHPLRDFSHRWTAEEWRHGYILHVLLAVTRAVNPFDLEKDRMVQMTGGEVPRAQSVAELLAYVALQEVATQVAHRNTMGLLIVKNELIESRDDAEQIIAAGKMARHAVSLVAGDEGLHGQFYTDTATAALQVDRPLMLNAIARQLKSFKMPGTGIPNFAGHSKQIAEAGIFGPREFYDQVVVPVLGAWGINEEMAETLTNEERVAFNHIQRTVSALRRVAYPKR